MIAVGIDPGKTGAIAAVLRDEVLVLEDFPLVGKSVDLPRLAGTILSAADHRHKRGEIFVALEKQQPFPGMKVSSTANLMHLYGVVEGLLIAYGWSYELVRPQRWKRVMLDGLDRKAKESSRIMAARLFPDADLGRRKDQGRSEALLLAGFVQRVLRP